MVKEIHVAAGNLHADIDKNMMSELRGIGLSDITIAAIVASRLGARRLLAHHGQGPQKLQVRFKADGTPVTVADQQSEDAITSYLTKTFPGVRIFGEEFGESGNLDSDATLHIDPLDGTGLFSRGGINSTVGIALRENNETQMAVACPPFYGMVVAAEKNKGVWLIPLVKNRLTIAGRPKRLQVSQVPAVGNRAFIQIDGNFFPKNADKKLRFLQRLVEKAQLKQQDHFIIGSPWSNIFQQVLVAIGQADANLTDCIGIPMDILFGDLAIREAGGVSTDIHGQPIQENSPVAVFSNGQFHDLILECAKEAYEGYNGFK